MTRCRRCLWDAVRTLKAPTAPGCRAAYLIAAELLHFPKRTNGPASEDPGLLHSNNVCRYSGTPRPGRRRFPPFASLVDPSVASAARPFATYRAHARVCSTIASGGALSEPPSRPVQRLNDRAGERGSTACGRALIERSAGLVGVVKSVEGAVPVVPPARFIEPLPETAVR